jgi:hypothetical protein
VAQAAAKAARAAAKTAETEAAMAFYEAKLTAASKRLASGEAYAAEDEEWRERLAVYIDEWRERLAVEEALVAKWKERFFKAQKDKKGAHIRIASGDLCVAALEATVSQTVTKKQHVCRRVANFVWGCYVTVAFAWLTLCLCASFALRDGHR